MVEVDVEVEVGARVKVRVGSGVRVRTAAGLPQDKSVPLRVGFGITIVPLGCEVSPHARAIKRFTPCPGPASFQRPDRSVAPFLPVDQKSLRKFPAGSSPILELCIHHCARHSSHVRGFNLRWLPVKHQPGEHHSDYTNNTSPGQYRSTRQRHLSIKEAVSMEILCPAITFSHQSARVQDYGA
jgi:hypothetical protein